MPPLPPSTNSQTKFKVESSLPYYLLLILSYQLCLMSTYIIMFVRTILLYMYVAQISIETIPHVVLYDGLANQC